MKRREFIVLSGIGATSASLLGACGHPEEKLIPALIPDDEYVPGIDYWKASTCAMCPAGCGIVVRTREHKANKIEGNPLHPINRGALCARGQAGLELLYNPDRIKGPMKRVGERGEGKWEEISWDEGIKLLADKLREIKARGDGKIAFATRYANGVTGLAAELLASHVDPTMLLLSERPTSTVAMSDVSAKGLPPFPIFDIANATYILSLGARFLETWESPVRYSVAYGEFRSSRGKARGRFVHAEPRMSLTASNADEWLPVKSEGDRVLALAIAQVIVRENLIKGASAPTLSKGSLDDCAPENTANITGLAPDQVRRIAREFASSPRPLAIGDGDAVSYLNQLAGNTNKPGGLLLAAGLHFDPLKPLRAKLSLPERSGFVPSTRFAFSTETLSLSALLVHGWNPRFTIPQTAAFLDAIPFVASFSNLMDETTAAADMILPDQSFLEMWDVTASPIDEKRVVVTTSQPVLKSELNTRQTADVLIAASRGVSEPGSSTPFESAEEMVRKAIEALNPSATETEVAQEAIERGFLIADAPNEAYESIASQILEVPASGDSSDANYPLRLLTYESVALGNGEFANLPALQELPDPMTSAMWGSWVEINPKTASANGIADGDLVEVRTEHGFVRVPAILYPAIRPDVIAMPFGQGHTGYGRCAANRGANPAVLNPGLQGTVGAKVSKVEGKANLIRFGTDLQERMESKSWR